MPKENKSICIVYNFAKLKIDLTKIIAHFENLERKNLRYCSVNYFNPSLRPNDMIIGGGRFFSSQLNLVVHNASPDSHFYWFKKINDFYQVDSNKDVIFDDAIKQVITPHVQRLQTSYRNIRALYTSMMFNNNPLSREFLNQINVSLEKIDFLTKVLPEELKIIAKKLGTYQDDQMLSELNESSGCKILF